MAERTLQVLIVDDSPADADLAARELRKRFGAVQAERVDTASALKAALQLGRWDAVISDNQMPAFSAMEALHLVKASEPDLPFILVTGTMGEEAAVETLKAGVDDYVLKSNLGRIGDAFDRQLREAELRRERRRSLDALRESEERFRQLAENIDLCFYLTDPANTKVFYLSPAYEKIWGRSVETVYSRPRSWLDAVHPDDRNEMVEAVQRAAAGPLEVRYRIIRADGAVRWLRSRRFPVRDPSGNPYRIAGIIEDITERRAAEEKIARLNRVYAVLSGINALIVRVRERDELFRDACRIAVDDGKFPLAWIALVDKAETRLEPVAWAGKAEGYLDKMPMAVDAALPEGRGMGGTAIRECKAMVANDIATDTRVRIRKEALERGFRSLAVLPLVAGGKAIGAMTLYAEQAGFFDDEEMKLLLELAGDISFALEHIEKSDQVRYLALYDPLTRLANRTLFHERLGERVRTADRERDKFAVCIFDIERFKTINDALGRQAGDALLGEVARRMTQAIEDAGRLARVGGDAFALLIPEVQNEDDAARRLERKLAACFRAPFRIGEQELRASAKAGVALFPNDGTNEETLFANAEAAWKKAKESGDRYLFYTQRMTEAVAKKLTLENKLRQALENDEFVLHYQPKVNMETRRIEGVEALIRWQSPELGLVPPMQFIPLMEETGLILEVGAWALGRAIFDHRGWVDQGLAAPRVAVNISAIQLRQRDFVARVTEVIGRGVTPPAIDLELTESLLMDDIEGNIGKLKAIRDLGVRIAIDDFGTGHSSLAYLARLPVDVLKIDRSFIITMLASPDTMTLVQTIVSLAHSLKLCVVAEGVDSEGQASVLRLLRCDQMQGYLVSKPLPFDGMTDLLSAV